MKVLTFFRSNTITDESRRELWKLKIGNRLNISREHYLGLITRLKIE